MIEYYSVNYYAAVAALL